MDNINNILNSDLLHRYVLGSVTPEERIKVDLLIIDQPVIRDAIRKVEIEVEKEAFLNKVTPPQNVKSAVIKQLHPKTNSSSHPTPSNKIFNLLKYAAVFIAGGLITWGISQPYKQRLERALESNEQELTKLLADCNELSDMYAFINDGATKPHLLSGEAFKKDADVVVYWNEERSKAMLRVVNLPSITSDKTYQLWADVDGEMLDLGIFDPAVAVIDPISIGYLDDATSLNITVEPAGGSDHPTVSTLTANKII